jgi:hypothetical protein
MGLLLLYVKTLQRYQTQAQHRNIFDIFCLLKHRARFISLRAQQLVPDKTAESHNKKEPYPPLKEYGSSQAAKSAY